MSKVACTRCKEASCRLAIRLDVHVLTSDNHIETVHGLAMNLSTTALQMLYDISLRSTGNMGTDTHNTSLRRCSMTVEHVHEPSVGESLT